MTTTFELPGINKENVSIDVHNSLLTVSGESKFESDRNEDGYLLRERRFGRFSRSVPIPEGIKVCRVRASVRASPPIDRLTSVLQPEEIKASMENGVLTVTYPRETAEQTPKKITIS